MTTKPQQTKNGEESMKTYGVKTAGRAGWKTVAIYFERAMAEARAVEIVKSAPVGVDAVGVFSERGPVAYWNIRGQPERYPGMTSDEILMAALYEGRAALDFWEGQPAYLRRESVSESLRRIGAKLIEAAAIAEARNGSAHRD